MRSFLILLLILTCSSRTFAIQSDWMAKIPDETSLASINIPGTHNSGATREPFFGTARCQSLTLREQLEAGVRFFDIRCRHQNDIFAIYHGPISQRLRFGDVLKTFKTFLQTHANETVILSIKEEHQPVKNTRPFVDTLQQYLNQDLPIWYTEASIPELGKVRGKIVLLRRFKSTQPLGIPATKWGHDGFHQSKNLFIQDRFSLPDVETKWKIITRAFSHSTKEESNAQIHLHFTSGYTQNQLGIPNIRAISQPINQRLADYLTTASHQRHGCIILDFITTELTESIYQLNFTRDN